MTKKERLGEGNFIKTQKIVTVEDGIITEIRTGTYSRGYGVIYQRDAMAELLDGNGTDWSGHIETLEKLIIALSRRHNGEDDEFIKEFFPGETGRWFDNTKRYFGETVIKFRTEKEKEELIQKIREDRY